MLKFKQKAETLQNYRTNFKHPQKLFISTPLMNTWTLICVNSLKSPEKCQRNFDWTANHKNDWNSLTKAQFSNTSESVIEKILFQFKFINEMQIKLMSSPIFCMASQNASKYWTKIYFIFFPLNLKPLLLTFVKTSENLKSVIPALKRFLFELPIGFNFLYQPANTIELFQLLIHFLAWMPSLNCFLPTVTDPLNLPLSKHHESSQSQNFQL